MYVRAFGKLKNGKLKEEKNSVVAFNIKNVTDFNEITYHLLECIYVFGGRKNNEETIIYNENKKSLIDDDDEFENPTYTKAQKRIIEIIRSTDIPDGPSFEDLASILESEKIFENEISKAIKDLFQNGELYSSKENHFRLTEN
jgi:hypothetical protein